MKRYTEESQLLAAINRCHTRSAEFYKMAEEWDKEADELFKIRGQGERAKELRLAAKAKRTRAHNLVDKKAKYYGEKLSEFRTAVSSAITTDTSVQA